jgi:Flp pilus assembly protein TadG
MGFPIRQDTQRRGETGQTFIMFVFFVVVLIAFVGLGIDLGFAYVTKANLAKAVDAACLMGVRNLYQGDPQAKAVASSAFAANYGRPGRDVGAVTPNVVVSTDASNNRIIDVDAAATIKTFFIRIIPIWKTLTVKANAEAMRAKLVMTLVLDRSGSMNGNGGCTALPPAVDTFIDLFDDNNDRVALATFASHARLDVPMSRPFKAAIKAKVPRVCNVDYNGGTFGQGGLTNALVQNNSVTVLPGENVVKVTVFFTDGLANIIQDTLNCPPLTSRNFGGFDSGNTVGFFDPSNGNQLCTTSGGTPSCCSGTSQFKSAIDGTMKSFTRANVSADAEFRAIQTANDMRGAGMVVYSIGLGNSINQNFLKDVANDPTGPNYNSTLPVGEAVFAPDASQLQAVFQTIASKILLRLSK